MNKETQWETILKNHRYPCYIADIDTDCIIYANDEYMKVIGTSKVAIGRPFYEVIINDNHVDIDEVHSSLKNGEVVEVPLRNLRYHINFLVTLVNLTKENVTFGMLTPTEDGTVVTSKFEESISRCMDIFAQPNENSLLSFMELLCEFYECDRAYVYRFNLDENRVNCVSQWSFDPNYHIDSEIETKFQLKEVIDWIEKSSEVGILVAEVSDLQPHFQKVLSEFQTKDLTLCPIEDTQHQIVGLVGLSNRKNFCKKFDSRLLSTIGRFVAQDVSQQGIDDTLFKIHYRDSLTGLYNRLGYARKVDKMKENPPETIGVISANINGLKAINDSCGNSKGDEFIRISAQKIKKYFGFDIFRVSGDEFIGICENIEEEPFENQVFSLHKTMRSEMNFDFSLGHSWGKGSTDLAQLLREADTIMYINKQEYYAQGTKHFDSGNEGILSDLLTSLANDEFMIYLQPQVRLLDSSLYGAEALIRRIDKKTNKMVFPDQFIPLYEQKSIIRHIDLFVIHKVCQLLSQWEQIGRAIPISVNLSRVTLQEYGIVNTIVEICEKYQVPHKLLVIEVTERVGLIENNVASALITAFKEHDFNISLDDFGCAYSNIVTLAQIEVDEVKIDKSLVDDLTTSKKNHILVKNVLTMCNELDGASTLAEGIENASQAQLLETLGCHFGQGYYYSRPIPVEEFIEKFITPQS